MNPKDIEAHIANLPAIPLGEVPNDEQAWDTQDGGAHLIVTRNTMATEVAQTIVGLTVSGRVAERRRVAVEFSIILGQAVHSEVSTNPGGFDAHVWLDNSAPQEQP